MPIRAKKILWPTDFSDLSLCAARYAKAFQELFGSELHIVHVVTAPLPMEVSLTMPAEVPMAVPEPELLDAANEGLRKIVAEQFDNDPTIKTKAFFGGCWSGICDYAREQGIELIIVTTHGRTGLQHVLTGSAAERIVQHAPCPVLVVKDTCTNFIEKSAAEAEAAAPTGEDAEA